MGSIFQLCGLCLIDKIIFTYLRFGETLYKTLDYLRVYLGETG